MVLNDYLVSKTDIHIRTKNPALGRALILSSGKEHTPQLMFFFPHKLFSECDCHR